MTSILEELFKHNLWANLRLLDACDKLSDAQLDTGAPGTYGRIRDTLVHLVGAEELYLALLTGKQPERPLRPGDGFPGIAELRERARRSGEGLVALAAHGDHTMVLRGTWPGGGQQGQSYAMSVAVPMVQAINHATEHRAHVITILSQLGVSWPELDGWAYSEDAGLIKLGKDAESAGASG
jgi:uncharacterized damage-inducible protein DinB